MELTLYGLLHGCLLKEMDNHVSVAHPLTGMVVTIPKGWLIQSPDDRGPSHGRDTMISCGLLLGKLGKYGKDGM